MLRTQDSFYLNIPEPNRSCLLALRSLILEQDERLQETAKYGMPCFCLAQKAICYLWVDKKTQEPYVLFVDGKHLNHPLLETGKRSRMKIFRVNPNADIPVKPLTELLQLAITRV